MLEDLHSRLAGVTIECLDWSDFIPRYDGEGTLFYLDPPYWGCEDDYGQAMFARADFQRMAQLLGSIKGRFILSLNDLPEVREAFAAFDLVEVRTTYTISGKRNDRAGDRAELLISNRVPENGFGKAMEPIHQWLDHHVGRGHYACSMRQLPGIGR
jgi:DNA adenine methylase